MRILYLDLDTLRPDHLGCYGYKRNTSPTIDSIARQGVRFDNYYCSDAPCLPSRAALITGQFGIHNGVVGHGGTAADIRIEGPTRDFRGRLARESLPALLRTQGIKPVLISPFAERHGAWFFYAGFSEMHNTGRCGIESAEEITPTVLDWIKHNAAKDNWYLHLNYWDPHTPYRAPASFGNPFKNDPLPSWLTEEVLEQHREMVCPHGARELYMFDNRVLPQYPRSLGELKDMTDLHQFIDGYDCGIRYLDGHIDQILSAFAQLGVLDDMAIIISSDHGENMGELGIYGEHATADYATCRIPMLIRWPGGMQGTVDTGLHYNLDLLPTLSDLFHAEHKRSWDGLSFAPAILEGKNCGREFLVLSQCAHVCQRSVRFGEWIYLRTYHDGFHLFPEEMLFNLNEDPYEQFDIANQNPARCTEAVNLLNQWHSEMMKSMPDNIDPLWTVMNEGGPYHAKGYLKTYCAHLEKTGRGWAIPELKKRHPQEFE